MKFLFDFFPSLETDSLSLSILFSTTTIDDKREYDTRDGFRKRITRVNGISPDDARGTRVVLFRWPPRVISVATSRPLSRLTSQGVHGGVHKKKLCSSRRKFPRYPFEIRQRQESIEIK